MTDKLELNVNAYLPLRDVVFQTLREAILRGDLKPGERLMEMQLAGRLGVSRTPIREAIRMLELEGLAVTVPRKGAEVARMTEKDMEDVLQIRKCLDELAVSLACDKMTEDQLGQIGEELQVFEESIDSNDVWRVAQADMSFHEAIYMAADNPKLVTFLNTLREQMYRYRVEYLKDVGNYPRLLREHREIYDGLARRDKEFVVHVMGEHILRQESAMKNIIREQGQ